jgi:hypothetical protein
VVLVHDFSLGSSYLYKSSSGQTSLVAGDKFAYGDTSAAGLGHLIRVEVVSIDPGSRTAVLRITQVPDRHPAPVGPGRILFGGVNDAEGIFIFGAKVHRIPPNSPLRQLLADVVTIHESESIARGAVRVLLQQEALQSIISRASAELDRLRAYSEPAVLPEQQTDMSGHT